MDDSFPFSSIIRQLSLCVDSQFMASFDIDSQLNNVPLDEVISIWLDFFISYSVNASSFFPCWFFRGISFQVSPFTFNDTMSPQEDGISMGSPFGPIFARVL